MFLKKWGKIKKGNGKDKETVAFVKGRNQRRRQTYASYMVHLVICRVFLIFIQGHVSYLSA